MYPAVKGVYKDGKVTLVEKLKLNLCEKGKLQKGNGKS
jgi:hypothetical protein